MMNKRKLRAVAMILASALPLAACGDGGGGGGVASTPAPTYQKLDQLSGNNTFQSAGINLTFAGGVGNNFGTNAFGSGVSIAYTAASDTYVLTAPNGTTATFAPSNVTGSAVGSYVTYSTPSGTGTENLILAHPAIGGVGLSYTLIGNWGHLVSATGQATIQLAVGGIPTLASDVPRSGSATYTANVTGGGSLGPINQSGATSSTTSFSANFASNSVSTAMTLVNGSNSASIGTFNGTGTISSTGPGFGGTLSGTFSGGSSATGSFSGVFTGPQAAEMGYGWYLTGTSGTLDGFVYGKKN